MNNKTIMENSEFVEQFQVSLYEDEILITTPSNRKNAFRAKIDIPIEIKVGWHDSIETKDSALNYHHCCGILILFGINPPSFFDLYKLLA